MPYPQPAILTNLQCCAVGRLAPALRVVAGQIPFRGGGSPAELGGPNLDGSEARDGEAGLDARRLNGVVNVVVVQRGELFAGDALTCCSAVADLTGHRRS